MGLATAIIKAGKRLPDPYMQGHPLVNFSGGGDRTISISENAQKVLVPKGTWIICRICRLIALTHSAIACSAPVIPYSL